MESEEGEWGGCGDLPKQRTEMWCRKSRLAVHGDMVTEEEDGGVLCQPARWVQEGRGSSSAGCVVRHGDEEEDLSATCNGRAAGILCDGGGGRGIINVCSCGQGLPSSTLPACLPATTALLTLCTPSCATKG